MFLFLSLSLSFYFHALKMKANDEIEHTNSPPTILWLRQKRRLGHSYFSEVSNVRILTPPENSSSFLVVYLFELCIWVCRRGREITRSVLINAGPISFAFSSFPYFDAISLSSFLFSLWRPATREYTFKGNTDCLTVFARFRFSLSSVLYSFFFSRALHSFLFNTTPSPIENLSKGCNRIKGLS